MGKIVLGLVVGVLATIGYYDRVLYAHDVSDELYYQQFWIAVINHNDNTCHFSPQGAMGHEVINVNYAGDKNDTTLGYWQSDLNTIFIYNEGLNVEVIAHEVSHAVESLLVRHQVRDTHVRAGIQGYLTDCVFEIVKEDYPQITE